MNKREPANPRRSPRYLATIYSSIQQLNALRLRCPGFTGEDTLRVQVSYLQDKDVPRWDAFVRQHQDATPYHLACWKSIIEKTYGHRTYFLIAFRNQEKTKTPTALQDGLTESLSDTASGSAGSVAGVLPLVHLKSVLFGNRLVSMPFFDLGGVLADEEDSERALLLEAVRLAVRLKADQIELRHSQGHQLLYEHFPSEFRGYDRALASCRTRTRTHKVRMLLPLPGSANLLMESFKSKLRSQVRKPMKEGLSANVGGAELIDDFYSVFAVNMRDLGSPVHSKNLMAHILDELQEEARVIIIRKAMIPVASSLVVAFGSTLYNPWASALREYSRLSPNMLLYWTMLQYACEKGLKRFDFGRSTPGEGTYKFKEQWGAVPEVLHWQYVILHGPEGKIENLARSRFEKAVHLWSKMPVSITKLIGPIIRKHISL